MDHYRLDYYDAPLLVEALIAYAALMDAEAACDPNSFAATLHADQARRADAIAADLIEQMRSSKK